jgi:hypothetical protein
VIVFVKHRFEVYKSDQPAHTREHRQKMPAIEPFSLDEPIKRHGQAERASRWRVMRRRCGNAVALHQWWIKTRDQEFHYLLRESSADFCLGNESSGSQMFVAGTGLGSL